MKTPLRIHPGAEISNSPEHSPGGQQENTRKTYCKHYTIDLRAETFSMSSSVDTVFRTACWHVDMLMVWNQAFVTDEQRGNFRCPHSACRRRGSVSGGIAVGPTCRVHLFSCCTARSITDSYPGHSLLPRDDTDRYFLLR